MDETTNEIKPVLESIVDEVVAENMPDSSQNIDNSSTNAVTDLLSQMGLNSPDDVNLLVGDEIWEVKANKQAHENKTESLRILQQLGIDDDESHHMLISQEVWEDKSDKELKEVRQEIHSVRMNLGIGEDAPGGYEEVWEKKAVVEKENGWNEPPPSSQLTVSGQISQWLGQFTRMISETKIF